MHMIDHCGKLKYSGVHAVHTMSATDILPLDPPGSHLGRVLMNAVVLLSKPGVGTKAFEVRLQAFVLLTCLACSIHVFPGFHDIWRFGVEKPARDEVHPQPARTSCFLKGEGCLRPHPTRPRFSTCLSPAFAHIVLFLARATNVRLGGERTASEAVMVTTPVFPAQFLDNEGAVALCLRNRYHV